MKPTMSMAANKHHLELLVLKHNLKEVINMWREVAEMTENTFGVMHEVIYRDCANDLDDILSGDLSCIEEMKAGNTGDTQEKLNVLDALEMEIPKEDI